MYRPKTLSAAFCKAISEAGRYGDGRGGFGLSLLVKNSANGRVAKSWAQRLRQNGRPYNLGLGKYPLISLAEAREAALRNARDNAKGRDLRGERVPVFAEALEAVIALHRDSWRGDATEREWRNSLALHVLPTIGERRLDSIESNDVLTVIAPLWNTKPETAKRLLKRISATLRWGIAQGHRQDDATQIVTALLPKNANGQTTHHAALPHGQVGDGIKLIRATGSTSATLCLEFLVLTAVRSGEARGARWDEIDHDAATWTIPASRMKAGRVHKVPLSDQAMAILDEARQLPGSDDLVFPSRRRGKLIDARTLARVLADAGIAGTVHGMRSSFRDWCAETGQPRDAAEAALAHTVGGTEGAYLRSDLYQQRQILMAEWGEYLK